jgi:hypothetical protein
MIQTTRIQLSSGIYVVIRHTRRGMATQGPQNNWLSHRPPRRFDVTIGVKVRRPTDMALADGDARSNDQKNGSIGQSNVRRGDEMAGLCWYSESASSSHSLYMRVMGDHALCRHLLEGAVSLFLPLFLLDILFNMPSANVLRLHVCARIGHFDPMG